MSNSIINKEFFYSTLVLDRSFRKIPPQFGNESVMKCALFKMPLLPKTSKFFLGILCHQNINSNTSSVYRKYYYLKGAIPLPAAIQMMGFNG
jgi:hypothetical protein